MIAFLLLTAVTFSLFGFIIGIWAKGFEHLQFIPMLDHHAAHFPGRRFLFHRHAAAGWRTFSLFNPIVYLISGFRWSFYGTADVSVGISMGMTLGFCDLLSAGGLDFQDRLPAEEFEGHAPRWGIPTKDTVNKGSHCGRGLQRHALPLRYHNRVVPTDALKNCS